MSWNRTTGSCVVDCPGPPWHWRAGTHEYRLALLLEFVERRIGIRQRGVPGPHGIRERPNTMVREQHALEGGEVVEEPVAAARLWICA